MTGSAGLDKAIWLRVASPLDVARPLVHAVVRWAGRLPGPDRDREVAGRVARRSFTAGLPQGEPSRV
jgi:hypothetical protein